jgi:hypothetical protein
MRSNIAREEKVVENTTEFTLKWPKSLDVKPDYTIQVTPTRTARVYKEARNDTENRNGKYVTVKLDGYRVIYVIDRTGMQPKADLDRYHGGINGHWYRTALDVQMAISQYSAANMPSKKNVTTNVSTVYSPDE